MSTKLLKTEHSIDIGPPAPGSPEGPWVEMNAVGEDFSVAEKEEALFPALRNLGLTDLEDLKTLGDEWQAFAGQAKKSRLCPAEVPEEDEYFTQKEEEEKTRREERKKIAGAGGSLPNAVPGSPAVDIGDDNETAEDKKKRWEVQRELDLDIREAAVKSIAIALKNQYYAEVQPYNIEDLPDGQKPFYHDVLSVIMPYVPNDLQTLASVRLVCRTWNFFGDLLPHWGSYTFFVDLYKHIPLKKQEGIQEEHRWMTVFSKMDEPFKGGLYGLETPPGTGSTLYRDLDPQDQYQMDDDQKMRAIGVLMLCDPAPEKLKLRRVDCVDTKRLKFSDLSLRLAELGEWQAETRAFQNPRFAFHRFWVMLFFWGILVGSYFVIERLSTAPQDTQLGDTDLGAQAWFATLALLVGFAVVIHVLLTDYRSPEKKQRQIESGDDLRWRNVWIAHDHKHPERPSPVWIEPIRHYTLYLVMYLCFSVLSVPIALITSRMKSIDLLKADAGNPIQLAPAGAYGSSCLGAQRHNSFYDIGAAFDSGNTAAFDSGNSGIWQPVPLIDYSDTFNSIAATNIVNSHLDSKYVESYDTVNVTTGLHEAWPGWRVNSTRAFKGRVYNVAWLQRGSYTKCWMALEVTKAEEDGGGFYTSDEVFGNASNSDLDSHQKSLLGFTLYRNPFQSSSPRIRHYTEVGLVNAWWYRNPFDPSQHALVYYNRPADRKYFHWLDGLRDELVASRWACVGIVLVLCFGTWVWTWFPKWLVGWAWWAAFWLVVIVCNPVTCFVAGLICLIHPPKAFMCDGNGGTIMVVVAIVITFIILSNHKK